MPFRLSDTEWVMIVVAAIYLFECACWVRREVLCLSTLLGRFRALPSPSFMGNERYKLVMGNPVAAGPLFPVRVVADRRVARRHLLCRRHVDVGGRDVDAACRFRRDRR